MSLSTALQKSPDLAKNLRGISTLGTFNPTWGVVLKRDTKRMENGCHRFRYLVVNYKYYFECLKATTTHVSLTKLPFILTRLITPTFHFSNTKQSSFLFSHIA
jgi:hypothetical protein